jgi:hypothetical protein
VVLRLPLTRWLSAGGNFRIIIRDETSGAFLAGGTASRGAYTRVETFRRKLDSMKLGLMYFLLTAVRECRFWWD